MKNNSVFEKTMKNVRNHRDVKLVTSDKRRKRLVSDLNYDSHKNFSDHLMAITMTKTRVKMTKPLYLGKSILGFSKILLYEFWYDYISPRYGDKTKLCYTDTDTDTDTDTIERWFNTCNYDKNDKRLIVTGKNQKVPALFKDEIGGKTMTEIVAFRPKAYAYLTDDGSEHKKSKGTKKCVIKQKLMFQNFKNCLFNNKTVYRSQERFKSYNHDVYTEEVNKIA